MDITEDTPTDLVLKKSDTSKGGHKIHSSQKSNYRKHKYQTDTGPKSGFRNARKVDNKTGCQKIPTKGVPEKTEKKIPLEKMPHEKMPLEKMPIEKKIEKVPLKISIPNIPTERFYTNG